MTLALFYDYLLGLDFCIKKQYDRHVFPLMNNCSPRGPIESPLELQRLKVKFLPPDTSSRLQPLNVGLFAAIKVCYRCHLMECAVGRADVWAKELYKVVIMTAMRWLLKVWKKITLNVISEFLRRTGLRGNNSNVVATVEPYIQKK